MGFIAFLISRLLVLVVICVIIAFLPGLPPHMEFTPYSVTPPIPLEGALSVNNKLNNAERLFEGQIKSPESFAVVNNTLFTGLQRGIIVKLEDNQLTPVANIGHECGGNWDEKNCGRPLGMQFDKYGMLYVVDAYYGIYKVNVHTGRVLHLISTDQPISNKRAKLANSVAIGQDGAIYWSVSNCDVYFDDAVIAMFGDPSGRLFRYDPITKTNTLLLDRIHFANGIALSANEDFIIVSETVRGRILRLWLKGPNKGLSEVFIDGLPGLPDNIHSNGKGGFFVTLILPRSKNMPLLSDLIAPYPLVRRLLARIFCLMEVPFELLHRVYPSVYSGTIMHWIGNLEYIDFLNPKGLISIELSETGSIIGSLQSTDNKVTSVSDVVAIDNYYYLGSPFNDYIGRVKINQP